MGHRANAFAARSIKRATSFGLEIYAAWLAGMLGLAALEIGIDVVVAGGDERPALLLQGGN
jgi:hypothetical protein